MIQTKGNGELKMSKQKGQQKRPGREEKRSIVLQGRVILLAWERYTSSGKCRTCMACEGIWIFILKPREICQPISGAAVGT